PSHVTVFLAHADSSDSKESLAKKLGDQLTVGKSSKGLRLEILDPSRDIQPGQDYTLTLRAMLERSDIVVALLSSDFLLTELGDLVLQYQKAGRRVIGFETEAPGREGPSVIPVLERPFDIGATDWGGLAFLPRDEKPLSVHARNLDLDEEL